MPSLSAIPSSATAVGRYVPAAEVTPSAASWETVLSMTRLPSWAWIAAAGATTSRRRARWPRKMATMSARVASRVPGIAARGIKTHQGRPFADWAVRAEVAARRSAPSAPTPGARTGRPGKPRCFPAGHGNQPHQCTQLKPRPVRERSLAARDERSESPVAGTKEGRKLTKPGGHDRTAPAHGRLRQSVCAHQLG